MEERECSVAAPARWVYPWLTRYDARHSTFEVVTGNLRFHNYRSKSPRAASIFRSVISFLSPRRRSEERGTSSSRPSPPLQGGEGVFDCGCATLGHPWLPRFGVRGSRFEVHSRRSLRTRLAVLLSAAIKHLIPPRGETSRSMFGVRSSMFDVRSLLRSLRSFAANIYECRFSFAARERKEGKEKTNIVRSLVLGHSAPWLTRFQAPSSELQAQSSCFPRRRAGCSLQRFSTSSFPRSNASPIRRFTRSDI